MYQASTISEGRARAAFKGKKQAARISFASPELLFRVMTANRWDIIRHHGRSRDRWRFASWRAGSIAM